MLTKSCKAKGRLLQNWVKAELTVPWSYLRPEDVKVAIMGEKGADIQLSPEAKKLFPYQIECKNLKKFVGYKYFKQAQQHGGLTPLVVIKANKEDPLVIIKASDFFKLSIRE